MYIVRLYGSMGTLVGERTAVNIGEARDMAAGYVQDRMDAFADDHDALKRYGFVAAEDAALDVPEDGATITLQDGYAVNVEPVNDELAEEKV